MSAIDTSDHSDMEYGKCCKVAPKVKKSHPGRETKSSAPSMPVAPPYPVASRQPSLHHKVTAPLPSGEITSKQPLSLSGSLSEIQTVAEVHTQPVSLSRSYEITTSAKLDKLLMTVDHIEKQQSKIITILTSMKNGRSEDRDIDEFSIPLDCDEDCQKLADDLKDKLKRRTLVGT